jgi:hypothetical protein
MSTESSVSGFGMFPVRMTAVLHTKLMLNLKRLPEVKDKAYQFTMDVVEDLNRMVEAFGKHTAPDEMLAGSWEDLKAMR